jgi:hypothetical protein
MALLRSETRIYGNATVDTFLKVDGNNTAFPANSDSTGALRVAGGIGVKGNVFSSGNITALNANLGNLVVANYVTGTLTTANQYNITNVGTLGNVTVTNSANVGTLNSTDGVFTGNLTVSGNFVYANVLTLNIKDPIIEQGGNTDGSPLTTDDNKDRGSLLHYYDGTAIDAFMGWDNSNSEFAFGSNVSVTGEVVTFNSYGNIRANYFLGNTLGSSETAATVTANAQPNITSLGTLNYLNVSNLSGGNGTVTANYFTGIITTSYQPNINSLGILSNLTVTGPVNLGNVANLTVYGGSVGQYLKTDGNGTLSWSTVTAGNANISGSNTQLFFNDANSNTLGTSANLTFNKSSNTLTVDKIIANGSLLTNITGSNIVGNVASAVQSHYANIANSITFANVSNTPTSLSGYGITDAYSNTNASAYLSSYTGNLTAGNASLGNLVTANYFVGNGSQLTGVSASSASSAGTVTNNAQPNITSVGTLTSLNVSGNVNFTGPNVSLGNVSNLHITGGTANYVLQTDGSGNLNWVSAGTALAQSGGINIISNISNVIAGSSLDFTVSYADPAYPGGTFYLDSAGPVTFTTTDAWSTGGTSKNAYANYIASTVNTANVSITLTLANATFNIKSTDTIVIGSNTITGSTLTGLGITGTGGTYTILSSALAAGVQTTATNSVTANLTTTRGVKTATGSTLTNNQPVPFNVTALSGTFASASVPYWSLNQTFNWNATTTSGATVASGNVTYSGAASGSLTAVGATFGTSPSLDSSSSYTITSSDYIGAGQYGAGTRAMTATVNGTVTAATKYYPLFYKITSSSAIPTFTVSDSRGTRTYALGDGANTNTNSGDYLWLVIPNYPSNSSSLASHTFKHVFGGFDIVDTPTVTGTQTITSAGQSYNYSIYGFSGFTTVSTIITTS